MMAGDFVSFCYGVAFAAACAASVFFYRFWRLSGDAFFFYFAAAFALLALQWIALVGANPAAESRPYYYLLRLLAFVLIIVAAAGKNRRPAARTASQP